MKIDEYLKIKDEVYQKARALSVSKGEDYSGKEDTLKNLKLAELMGLCSAEAGILVRLSDKLMRLVGFVHNGNFSVQDEKLLDTVVDVHNYIDLFYAVVKEKSEGTNDIINQMEESTKQAKEWLKRRMLEEMSVEEIKRGLDEAGYEIGSLRNGTNIPKKVKIAYLSYPFSDDPIKRTKEVRKLATQIAVKELGVFPIAPHLAFDFMAREEVNERIQMKILESELSMIKRCDMLIIGHNPQSVGMRWETAYAKMEGKKIMRVVLDANGDFSHLEPTNGDEK